MVDEKKFKEYVDANVDEYGKCCVDVAREVMRLMDEQPDRPIEPDYEEFSTHMLICKADNNIDAGGITGFMAACVAQMVMKCHSRGDEFRRMWNLSHGVSEEKAKGGIVNPAILNVNVDK